MLTVIASGVTQQPLPRGETCSHAPPVAVDEVTVKLMFELVLPTVRVCGKGLLPPSGMVKLMGFTWLNTESPTTTVTGIVALPVAVKISS